MAGLYAPVVTSYPKGVFSITSNKGTPYPLIQESMGSYQYRIDEIYLQANTAQQLFQPISFRSYDANGTVNIVVDVITINPYQKQNSLFIKPVNKNLILDGRTSIKFDLLPNEEQNMVFFTTEQSNDYGLKEPNFFDDYFFKQQQDDFFNGFVEQV
jgi:hypothetical protein